MARRIAAPSGESKRNPGPVAARAVSGGAKRVLIKHRFAGSFHAIHQPAHPTTSVDADSRVNKAESRF